MDKVGDMKKPSTLIAVLALTSSLVLAGCSSGTSATESEETPTPEVQSTEAKKPEVQTTEAKPKPEVQKAEPVDLTPTIDETGFGQKDEYVAGAAIVTVPDVPEIVGKFITVSMNFLDADGNILATTEDVQSPSWPGEQMIFTPLTDVTGTVASVTVAISVSQHGGGDPAQAPLPALQTNDIVEDYSSWQPAFQFTNDGEQLDNLGFHAVCRNAEGAIIGSGVAFPSLVPAGGAIRIEPSIFGLASAPTECYGVLTYW